MRIDEILLETEQNKIKDIFKNNVDLVIQKAKSLLDLNNTQIFSELKKYKINLEKLKNISRTSLLIILAGFMIIQSPYPASSIENQVDQYIQTISPSHDIPQTTPTTPTTSDDSQAQQDIDKYAQYKASLPVSKIKYYLEWIGEKSKLNTDIPLPKIYVVGDDILMKELRSSSSSGEPVKIGNPDAVMAFFDDVNGGDTIYIRKKFWDKEVIFNNKKVDQILVDSIIVHELYHYVQHQNGYSDVGTLQCAAQAEPNAYKIQNIWLKEHGSDFNIGGYLIYMSSICDPEDPPV